MARFDLTDEEWAIIKPPLPPQVRGPERKDDRKFSTAFSTFCEPVRLGVICRIGMVREPRSTTATAVAECIWEIDGGRVRLADLRVRSPEVIRWDPITHEPLLLTRQTPAGQPLPPAKFVLLTAPRIHGGQPHGPGIGNWCFWPVWLKRFACSSWATALERFGTPIATATVRNRTGEEAQAEMREALTALAALASGTSLVLPEGIEIDVLESARRAGGDYEIFIRDMDRMIADAVIGQHGTAEIGPHVGTGEVHMKILERLVTADARRCADALRRSVATWLTHWNHPGAAVPLLRRETAPPEDLRARSERDLNIARASGMRPARDYIEDVYGGSWEDAPPPAMPPAVPGSDDPPAAMGAPRHALAGPPTPPTPIDALVNHLIGGKHRLGRRRPPDRIRRGGSGGSHLDRGPACPPRHDRADPAARRPCHARRAGRFRGRSRRGHRRSAGGGTGRGRRRWLNRSTPHPPSSRCP